MALSRFEMGLLREHFPQEEALAAAIAQVESGEPLAYVIGEWYFYNETYRLNDDCLIPRPDTEHLCTYLIDTLPTGGRFLDLCTGSGCIAISTLCARKDLTADAVDIAPGAVEMARYNAMQNRVEARFSVSVGDVKQGQGGHGLYDAIVSNPPYICSDVIETLSVQVRREPHRALDGGAEGMDFYEAILRLYAPMLCDGGCFVFEIGYDQGEKIKALGARMGYDCVIRQDWGGNDRVALLTARA